MRAGTGVLWVHKVTMFYCMIIIKYMLTCNCFTGSPELNDPTFVPDVKWRAFDDPTFKKGFMLLEVQTKSLHFQYIRSEENTVVDDFVIIRT